MTDKLFIVVRADLAHGPQAVQAIHAAIAFYHENPSIEGDWHLKSNTLALLTVPDE